MGNAVWAPEKKELPDLGKFWEEEVFARITTEMAFELASANWQKTASKWHGNCPRHQSKSGTALYVDPVGKLWRCPGCGVGGSILQWERFVEGKSFNDLTPTGLDFVEAVRRWSERVGVTFPERELTDEEKEKARYWETRRAILLAVITHCEAALWAPEGASALAYLRERTQIGDDAIRRLRLGFYPSQRAIGQALHVAGYDPKDVQAAGVLRRVYDGYLSIAWFDHQDRPLNIYFRAAGDPPKGRAKLYSLPGDGVKGTPFCFNLARRAGHKELRAVEGIFDAVVLQARGDTRVISYVAAEFSRLQVEALKQHGIRSVTIIPDPDGAGAQGAKSCIRALDAAGIRPYVAPRLPEGMDPDQFIIAHGLDAWNDLVAKSCHGYRYMARAILEEHGCG